MCDGKLCVFAIKVPPISYDVNPIQGKKVYNFQFVQSVKMKIL